MRELKLPKWKTKKRLGFRFYFTIFVSAIICASVAVSASFAAFTDEWLVEKLHIPKIVVVIVGSLLVGLVLSRIVGKICFEPIKKIRNAMNEVSQGNLDIAIGEECFLDELEDISHAFNVMVKELRSTESIQADFVSNVSHEFKTPLTAIQGYAVMLDDEEVTREERAEYTRKVLFNAKRMSELVNNILLLSKLDNQGIEDRKERFALDEQIRQSILATETKWTEKNIEFDVKLERIDYNGNGGLLSHVWGNLLDNAIKFSPESGKIVLELKAFNGYVYFSVSDEGEGIREDSKQYIFDKFYQSDTSHKQEGNGLGLALVKKITDIYGGEVEAENLGKGCKFIVRLPME